MEPGCPDAQRNRFWSSSEHPLGKSVVQAAQEQFIEVAAPSDFEALPGSGVKARVGQAIVVLGKPQVLISQGIVLNRAVENQIASAARAGQTVILTAVNQEMSGLMVFEDTIRPESLPMLQRLREMGLRTILLTGDH